MRFTPNLREGQERRSLESFRQRRRKWKESLTKIKRAPAKKRELKDIEVLDFLESTKLFLQF